MSLMTFPSRVRKIFIHYIACITKIFLKDFEMSDLEKRLENLNKLWFVVDIPLFIDNQSVEKLYDALSRPEFTPVSKTTSETAQKTTEEATEIGGGISAGLPPFLKAKMNIKLAGKDSEQDTSSTTVTQEANRTPEMQFEKILGFYAQNYEKRIFWASATLDSIYDIRGKEYSWDDIANQIDNPAPRPLIIFDLAKGSKIIPMAGETVDSRLKEISKTYIGQLDRRDGMPRYGSDPEQSKKYWGALEESFNSTIAMRSVESATKDGGRLDWIDYRLVSKVGNEVFPVHLHLAPRGAYNTGTFAYQTVRRGYKHGLRVIGTLKQGMDVNVLAIYEK